MYFYDLEDITIVKYEVKINISELKKLKKEIIKNCSRIVHKSYETTQFPNVFLNNIKNYNSQNTGRKDENNNDIYLVSYDLYIYPYLVTLINELLLNNMSVINELQEYQEIYSIEQMDINGEYKKLLDKINSKEDIKIVGTNESEEDRKKRKQLLKEMEKLLTNFENQNSINSKSTEIDKYRLKVLNCINLKKIGNLSLKTFIEIQDFFTDSTEKVLNKNLIKILNRPLIKEEL